jgi:hypothetical protein
MSALQASETRGTLTDFQRSVLRACGPMNVIGALLLAPPFPFVRRFFGLPDGHAIWLWMLSIWVLLFGVAYWHTGASGRFDRTFLAVGAAGKATFGIVLLVAAATGATPVIAIALGLPDLVLAVMFAAWLLRD